MVKLELIQKLFMHGLTQNMAKELRLCDKKKRISRKQIHKYAVRITRWMLSDTRRGVSSIKKIIRGSKVFKNLEIFGIEFGFRMICPRSA